MPDKIKVVISDFHMGSGHAKGALNPHDDFYYDEKFTEFLEFYSSGEFEDAEVELIINGDFLDLLKVQMEGKWPDLITERIAVEKVRKCIAGHPEIFAAMKKFIEKRRKTITYIPANHDQDFLFAAPRVVFRETLGVGQGDPRVRFIINTDVHLFDGIYVTHGAQFEVNNALDYDAPFITKGVPEPVLKLPWGSQFILKVINPGKFERPYIDMVKPFRKFLFWGLIFDFVFMFKILVKSIFNFVLTRLRPSPFIGTSLMVTLRILSEQFRVTSELDRFAKRLFARMPELHTVIMGHSHQTRCRSMGPGKLYINTGTWMKMISLDLESLGRDTALTYAVIEYEKDSRPVANLMRWRGRSRPYEVMRF